MQSKATHGSIKFFETVSLIGGEVLIFASAAVAWIFFERPRAFYYALAVAFNVFIMSVGKMGYHDPRPYMVDDDV